MNSSPSFAHGFLRRLQSSNYLVGKAQPELPSYDFNDASEQRLLITNSHPESFRLGTGASIFTDCLIPAITSARREVILVTCFWAPSATLTALRDALAKLAEHRRALIHDALARGAPALPPLRIRICLSSRSLLQKLLHPQSRDGYTYSPSSWPRSLGLPEPALLEAGAIQLRVKSLFFLPFSVMHPKFVIIDRQLAFVPSSNVSWESWLEGCVEITGEAVRALLSFYSRTWERTPEAAQVAEPLEAEAARVPWFDGRQADLTRIQSDAHYCVALHNQTVVPTFVLPSPSHRNPCFRPLPWQKPAPPPGTPLNLGLLQLFEQAQHSIYIQTPNITCEPVLAALVDALARGVAVSIVTNRCMMILEQLVTAGTTTSWCIRSLIRRFRRLRAGRAAHGGRGAQLRLGAPSDCDVEANRPPIGRLQVSYFHPRCRTGREDRARLPAISSPNKSEEPVHSHLKLTIVDAQFTVLGSGNMDRASWYTSQELGLLFQGSEFCAEVQAAVEAVLEGRIDVVFDSDNDGGPARSR